jgi:hypothetical protein
VIPGGRPLEVVGVVGGVVGELAGADEEPVGVAVVVAEA